MSRPRAKRSFLAAALFSALALGACGGGGADFTSIELMLRTGQLDRAEAALAGNEGERANALRERIRERRTAYAALEVELAELESLEPKLALASLRERSERERDPVAREIIGQALSRASDRRASDVASREHATASYVPTHPQEPATNPAARTAPVERNAERDADMLSSVIVRVSDDLVRGEWARAIAELEMAMDRAGPRVTELQALREQARHDAEAEARELAESASGASGLEELVRRRELLAGELGRFPSGSGLELVRDAMDALEARESELRTATIARPLPPPAAMASASSTSATEASVTPAELAESEGDLERAIDLWLESAFEHPPGSARDAAVARARGLEQRLVVRKEVAAAFARDASAFAELEVSDVGLRSITVAGQSLTWSTLPIHLLVRIAREAELSSEAELGLLSERVARGDAEGPAGALAEAQRLVEQGTIDAAQAWSLVARARGELVPDGGYTFASGRWTPRAEAELAAAHDRLQALETKLVKAKPAQREALLDELVAQGELAGPAVERALGARFESAVRALARGNTIDQLTRVAEQRRVLDQKRTAALELIFDEEEYFYPYNPPEVPAEKANLYWPVQQRVDALVAAVREVWDAPLEVKPPASFREALAEIAWVRAEARAFDLAFELPADLPSWVSALDPEVETLGLHAFAWDADDADSLAYDRAVLAHNERLWSGQAALPKEQCATDAEQRQVRMTNDYRLMLGRRALAWNPLIEAAARMHSEYMANTGDFGHYEPDPERRTPGDRMRLAGYTFGVGENCAMNGGDPEGAHYGWTHSSGHHRNLLNPGHREMASAVASRYWTQNFGVDRSFVGELEAWQD